MLLSLEHRMLFVHVPRTGGRLKYFISGGAPLATTPGAPTLTIPSPSPGEYLVRISTDAAYELDGCSAGSPVPPAPAGTSHSRNHGMYLGCNPVCSPTPFDAKA